MTVELVDPMIGLYFCSDPNELGMEFRGNTGGVLNVVFHDRERITDTIQGLIKCLEVFDQLEDGVEFEEAVAEHGLAEDTNEPLTMEDFEP